MQSKARKKDIISKKTGAVDKGPREGGGTWDVSKRVVLPAGGGKKKRLAKWRSELDRQGRGKSEIVPNGEGGGEKGENDRGSRDHPAAIGNTVKKKWLFGPREKGDPSPRGEKKRYPRSLEPHKVEGVITPPWGGFLFMRGCPNLHCKGGCAGGDVIS